MANNRLLEAKNYQSNRVEFGDETCHVSKSSDVSYQRIPIKYDGKQFLLKAPKCKSFGVQTTEMENGYTRRTMPLVFDDFQSDEQAEFSRVFSDIARNAYEQLVLRGYPESKLSKLELFLEGQDTLCRHCRVGIRQQEQHEVFHGWRGSRAQDGWRRYRI